MHVKFLTTEELAQIELWRSEGATWKTIGQRLGRNHSYLCKIFKHGRTARLYVCSNCGQPTNSKRKLCNAVECRKLAMRAHQKENRIKYAYKQTNEYIASLYESQAGCCLICGMAGLSPGVEPDSRDKKVLRIDHDHDTGEVRGLLCHRCNIGIGYLLEKPDLLRKAADYIEGHE